MSTDDRPVVEVNPRVQGGAPCVRGVPVITLTGAWWYGTHASLEDLLEDYGITRADLVVACWYLAEYGARSYRQRWQAWASQVHDRLWRGDYDVPLPPQKGDDDRA